MIEPVTSEERGIVTHLAALWAAAKREDRANHPAVSRAHCEDLRALEADIRATYGVRAEGLIEYGYILSRDETAMAAAIPAYVPVSAPPDPEPAPKPKRKKKES